MLRTHNLYAEFFLRNAHKDLSKFNEVDEKKYAVWK